MHATTETEADTRANRIDPVLAYGTTAAIATRPSAPAAR